MKRFVVALMSLCLLSFSILAQTERTTRPRVITAPTPREDSSSEPKAKRPPVMIGDTKTSSPTATPTTPSGEVVEEDNEVIKVETNLVTFPVSVLDRDGRFITGLKKEDFQIFENGVEQQIDSFATVEQPFTVILMIDVSPSTAFRIDEIHEAAITFVDQLRRDDKVIVISFDEKIRVLSKPTNNRATLQNAIRKAQFGSGTSVYEAVDYAINRELRRIDGRKAVVLFTDGVDTASRRATYQSTVRETQEIDALFYPIRYDTYDRNKDASNGTNYPKSQSKGGILGDIVGVIFGGGNIQIGDDDNQVGAAGTTRAEYETGRKYLEELARNSGGRKFEANNDLSAAFSGIAEELRRQYSLGYYPETAGQKGERKKIRVRVKRPNLVVRAKDSYIVGATDKKLAGK